MTKKLIWLLMCFILIISFSGCGKNTGIFMEINDSFYSDFSISNNKVYIKCNLTVNNSTENCANISFIGYFDEDFKNGLLKNAEIKGYSEDLKTSVFSMPKGKKSFTVIFIGDFSGCNQKANRQLPDIRIIQN